MPQQNWDQYLVKPQNDWDQFKVTTPQPSPVPEPPEISSRNWWQLPFTSFNDLMGIDRKVTGGIMDVPGAIWDIGKNAFQNPHSIPGMFKGFGQGAVEGAGNFAPIDALDLATGFGKAPLVRGANQVISGLTAAHGVSNLSENPLTGVAEIAGGALGLAGNRPRTSAFKNTAPMPEVLPAEVPRFSDDRLLPRAPEVAGALPAKGQTGMGPTGDTRFYQGARGVADSEMQYPVDLFNESRLSPGATSNPPAGLADVTPVDAAQYGAGSIRTPVDPIVQHPTFDALLPDSLKPYNSTPIDVLPMAKDVTPSKFRRRYQEGGKVLKKGAPPKPSRFINANQLDVIGDTDIARGLKVAQEGPAPIPKEVPILKLIGALSSAPRISAKNRAFGNLGPRASVAPRLNDNEVKTMFETVRDNVNLTAKERSYAQQGLYKILDPNSTKLPDEAELRAIERAFGTEFGQAIRNIRPGGERAKQILVETANLPRAIMATMDFSAPLRQGLPLIHKKEFRQALPDMFKSWGSEEAYRALQDNIRSNPSYDLGQKYGLQITDLDQLSHREENFMSTWVDKVPLARRSNRAYTAFLNKLRMDTFNTLVNQAGNIPADRQDYVLKELAGFVNSATGRGNLGVLERHAEVLNTALFSPRLQAARIDLVRRTLDPRTYSRMPKEVRYEALKSLFYPMAMAGTVTALASQVPGVEVTLNPTNSDFGKIKIGNTRIDPYGGFQQYAVLAARQLMQRTTSPVSGQTRPFGTGFNEPNAVNVGGRFVYSKANPLVGFLYSALSGKESNLSGRPANMQMELAQRVVPIILQDLNELYREDPAMATFVIPAIFGMGVQTFGGEQDFNRRR